MNRGRSRSRRSYDYDYDYRSPSPFYSRSPSPLHPPRKLRTRSATRSTEYKHGFLRTSAGVIAGVGLATLAVHKLFPDRDHERRRRSRSSSSDSRDTHAVKDRLRRRGDDIVARNRQRDHEGGDGPIYPRTTVRRRGDTIIYEDIVPARDVDGGWRGHKAMQANGFKRISRGRSLDERDRRQRDGHAVGRDEYPDDRYYPRREGERDYSHQPIYPDTGPRR